MNLPPVNFVVALPAEAKPIAALFRLQRLARHGDFPVYRRASMSLVVSGVGRAAAAAATEFLHKSRDAPELPIWINLGIAGHRDLAIGEALLARRITDDASGRQWHPSLAFAPPLRTEDLITLDQPAFDYTRPAALDMEASAFYPRALGFTRPELVHCLKVVSDNRYSPAEAISGKQVSAWISRHRDALTRLLQILDDVRKTL